MANPQDTRERLLQATLELISEKGYHGASTREIAQRAGVSELTLFRHFGKKEILFEEMFKAHIFLPRLKHLLPTLVDLPVEEAFRTVGIRFLETLKERKSLVRIILCEMNTYPEKVRLVHSQAIRETATVLMSYLESLKEKGVLRDVPLEAAAFMYLRTLFSHFMNEEILRQRELTPSEVKESVRHHVDIFLHGIVAGEGPASESKIQGPKSKVKTGG